MKVHRKEATSSLSLMPETLNFIINMTPDDKIVSILDLGCGTGMYGYMLRSMFKENIYLTGVDMGTRDIFRKRILPAVYDKFIDGNILTYKPDRKYDLLFINHVLEHILLEDAIKFIKKSQKDTNINSILIGLPRSRRNHVYNIISKSPHTHKWGNHQFPHKELGFEKHFVKFNNTLLFWERNKK